MKQYKPSSWIFKRKNRLYSIVLSYSPKIYGEPGYSDYKAEKPWLLEVSVKWTSGHSSSHTMRYKTRENAKNGVHKLQSGSMVLG